MFDEFDNSAQLCSSRGFKYFSISLPFPSIIFAFTGLHLAYHNKQIFKFNADTGTYICDYRVYALLLVHSIGSFLSSIAALCLPIFGTYLCNDIDMTTGYTDAADMGYNTSIPNTQANPLIYLIHSFAGCLLFLLNMLSSVFGFFTLLKRSRRGLEIPVPAVSQHMYEPPPYVYPNEPPPPYESLQLNDNLLKWILKKRDLTYTNIFRTTLT